METTILLDDLKSDFNINTDLTDITFRKISASPYISSKENKEFGEKKCVLYHIEVTLFNIEVILKVLSFKYESHAEVLKLEIKVANEWLMKEIAPCKNFLQRKRNMNLTFEALIKFIKLFEMRRLICMTMFKKHPKITLVQLNDGKNIKFFNYDNTLVLLECNWFISWNVDTYEISDLTEFYFNKSFFQGEHKELIRKELQRLVEPCLDFHTKLKVWSSVIGQIYDLKRCDSTDNKIVINDTTVLEINDSDSDESEIIEIDDNVNRAPSSDEIMVID